MGDGAFAMMFRLNGDPHETAQALLDAIETGTSVVVLNGYDVEVDHDGGTVEVADAIDGSHHERAELADFVGWLREVAVVRDLENSRALVRRGPSRPAG